jgi:CRISPR-associated protein Cas1
MLSLPDFKQKQIVVALLSHGEKMSFKNDNIVIHDFDGTIKYQSTCYRLFALFVVRHITVTTGLLQRAKKFGFSIFFLSHSLSPYGSWLSGVQGNVLLRRKQYTYNDTLIAQHIVKNKIEQQIGVLNKKRDKSEKLVESLILLHEYSNKLPNKSFDFQVVLGIEGVASRVYFEQLFQDIGWCNRKPRVKHDIVNLLLDIGYTLLFNLIDAMLNLYGFDTYQGVYHREFYQRKSLVCDIVEPFRPIIDKTIRKAYKLGMIEEKDFDFVDNQYHIFGKKSQPYISFLLKGLMEHKDDMFLYVQSYYRAFMRDRDISSYPVFRIDK